MANLQGAPHNTDTKPEGYMGTKYQTAFLRDSNNIAHYFEVSPDVQQLSRTLGHLMSTMSPEHDGIDVTRHAYHPSAIEIVLAWLRRDRGDLGDRKLHPSYGGDMGELRRTIGVHNTVSAIQFMNSDVGRDVFIMVDFLCIPQLRHELRQVLEDYLLHLPVCRYRCSLRQTVGGGCEAPRPTHRGPRQRSAHTWSCDAEPSCQQWPHTGPHNSHPVPAPVAEPR